MLYMQNKISSQFEKYNFKITNQKKICKAIDLQNKHVKYFT